MTIMKKLKPEEYSQARKEAMLEIGMIKKKDKTLTDFKNKKRKNNKNY